MPKRIQRSRAKGWRMPAGAVYVGRPSFFGNPARLGKDDPATVVQFYRDWLANRPDVVRAARAELAGKDLVCWCPLADALGNPVPCHADVLLELANALTPTLSTLTPGGDAT